ncbi:hypothetical protein [Sporolactobacillus spathodeae]|uniref:Uncharacterized protein n=1 Tax=Sporolactobacillus spathodeae TaxID=1465502 RepID=A0ABS2QA16_9BACL|nr:hypothetical protein [Sporolactobacillus spathodeae]MBM7658639.1 hypothetical protein [Sporolactobacillus spathodeae]
MNKEQEFTHQFKNRDHTGEHRNGRLAREKNSNSGHSGVPNEYVHDKKED